MLHVCSFALIALLQLALVARWGCAAETLATPVLSAPSAYNAAACRDQTARAAQQYFYKEFPRQLAAVQREMQLAEAELALVTRHLETYRPIRSFGRYAATYTADQAWQASLLAATLRIEALRQEEIELWRQRQNLAEGMLQSTAKHLLIPTSRK